MSEVETENLGGLSPQQAIAFNELTETEKAAIVMFLLEENGASAVMKTLSPGQVTSVSRAMIKVSDVDQPIVVAVVDEFLSSLQGLTDLGMGGPDYVRRVLHDSVGESKPLRGWQKWTQRHALLVWKCWIGWRREQSLTW